MRLLLDTHLILWALDDSPRLPFASGFRANDFNVPTCLPATGSWVSPPSSHRLIRVSPSMSILRGAFMCLI